jgi:hypothetical protein
LRYRPQTVSAAELPEEILLRLSPEVLELVSAAGPNEKKKITENWPKK